MSWSAYYMGTPQGINQALDKQSEGLTGQSKIEFDEALPHIKALLGQNFHSVEGQSQPILQLQASGSGYSNGDQQLQRNCTVSIQQIHGLLV